MADLKKMIINEFENDKGLQSDLSQRLNYDRTSFHKFLHTEKRQLSDLYTLIKVVDYFFPKQRDELLNDYFLTISPSTHFARQALEYSAFKKLPCTSILIDSMRECSNRASKEIAELYFLHQKSKNLDDRGLKVLMDEVYAFKSTEPKADFFKEFCLVGFCYRLDYFGLMQRKIDKANEALSEIEDPFFNDFYSIRIMRISAVHQLYNANTLKARELCTQILDRAVERSVLQSTFHTLGISYLFENFEKGLYYLEKANSYCDEDEKSYSDISSSINLHCLKWKRPIRLYGENHVSRLHEKVLSLYNRKDILAAEKLLKTIEEKSLSRRDRAFHLYLYGLVKKDKEWLIKSIMQYKAIGDKFYMEFPKSQLKLMGTENLVLEAICS